MTDIATGPGWELRLGNWRDVLRDVTADTLATDPPFSVRTHAGHTSRARRNDCAEVRRLGYRCWSADDLEELILRGPTITGWRVVLTDHVLARDVERCCLEAKLYAFAPFPAVLLGSSVRIAGEGPANWAIQICVARPHSRAWLDVHGRALPGAYVGRPVPRRLRRISGQKPVWLMKRIVRDYSERGELVLDPCAGSGTTGVAALLEGRRFIGAEVNPETFALAARRLRRAVAHLEQRPSTAPGRQLGLELEEA